MTSANDCIVSGAGVVVRITPPLSTSKVGDLVRVSVGGKHKIGLITKILSYYSVNVLVDGEVLTRPCVDKITVIDEMTQAIQADIDAIILSGMHHV